MRLPEVCTAAVESCDFAYDLLDTEHRTFRVIQHVRLAQLRDGVRHFDGLFKNYPAEVAFCIYKHMYSSDLYRK